MNAMGGNFILTGEMIDSDKIKSEEYDVVIIGGGPAGLTAGIYSVRYGFSTMLIEKLSPGGQMTLTETIENYPGFEEPISGYDLSMKMEKQAKKFGVKIHYAEVLSVDFKNKLKEIKTSDGKTIKSKAVIIATGASSKKLQIPGESEFTGKGVSYCGTCDAPLFKDKIVAVIGGGDTALEESLVISKHAKKIYLIHRRNKFRGQKFLQDLVFKNEKIEIIWDTIPLEITGNNFVNGLKVKNVKTNEENILKVDGVFVFIGVVPNSDLFKGQIERTDNGFIKVNNLMHTSMKGVFACGDVIDKELRQVTTAVGEGAKAAFQVYKYITENF